MTDRPGMNLVISKKSKTQALKSYLEGSPNKYWQLMCEQKSPLNTKCDFCPLPAQRINKSSGRYVCTGNSCRTMAALKYHLDPHKVQHQTKIKQTLANRSEEQKQQTRKRQSESVRAFHAKLTPDMKKQRVVHLSPQDAANRRLSQRLIMEGRQIHRSNINGIEVYTRGYENKTISLVQHLFTNEELKSLQWKNDIYVDKTLSVSDTQVRNMKTPIVRDSANQSMYCHQLDHSLEFTSTTRHLWERFLNFFYIDANAISLPGDQFSICIETKSLKRVICMPGNDVDSELSDIRGKADFALRTVNGRAVVYVLLNWTPCSVSLYYFPKNYTTTMVPLGQTIVFINSDDNYERSKQVGIHQSHSKALQSAIATHESISYFVTSVKNLLKDDVVRLYARKVQDNLYIDLELKLKAK